MNNESLMPLGAHKGKKMKDVPDEYLLWLSNQDWLKGDLKAYLKAYVQENLDAIKQNCKNAE